MPDMSAIANPQQRQFNPYTENGGTILAVAGADFTVIAGDTRQSEGYSIQTRYAPKVFRLSVQFFLLEKKIKHLLTRRLEPTALYSP
jgi:20S proteasome alpha/beta subunit